MSSINEADFDLDQKRWYRTQAGQNSDFGVATFQVLTNGGNGHGWFQNGVNKEDHQLVASGHSIETLGNDVKRKRDAAQDPIVPVKFIKCLNGDIVLDCDNGDFIVKADNIKMEAKGIRDTMDGDIQLIANKSIHLQSEDVRVTAATFRVNAKKEFGIIGKSMGEIAAGVLHIASAADFGASIELDKLDILRKQLEATS